MSPFGFSVSLSPTDQDLCPRSARPPPHFSGMPPLWFFHPRVGEGLAFLPISKTPLSPPPLRSAGGPQGGAGWAVRARYLSCELGGRGVSGFPWGRPGGAWEAGLLSVGDEGSTLVPEETRAGTQSDLVRNLARKSREVHWGGRPRKGSLSAEGSPGKGGDLLRDPLGGVRDLKGSRGGF